MPKSLFLIKLQAAACNFIKKETQALVFFCEFCEIFKNTFFAEQHWVTASDTDNFGNSQTIVVVFS